jgi:TPR repeat protein
MSLNFESAVGMFGTMHIDDYKPSYGSFVHPPYNSKREIWNEVAKKAYSGNTFCKYMLANAYYYGYISDFKNEPLSQYEWDAGALQLYEECADLGLSIAIPNLVNLLTSGRNGEPIQQKLADKYLSLGADLGVGLCERMIGIQYAKSRNAKMALDMYERAIEHRDFYAYYYIGKLYSYNGGLELDLDKALEYFNKGYDIFPDSYGFCNRIGEIYFHRDKDYEKAFYYLNKAYSLGSHWGADMLGTCYLYGLGCAVSLDKARSLFSLCPKKRLAISGLKKLS